MRIYLSILTAFTVCCLIPVAQAKRAPHLEMKDLAGNTHKLSELRGSIAVINFWATWCVPCREELPTLSKLNKEYAGKKIRFVAVSVDEPKDRAKIDQFLRRQLLDMEVWVGADLEMLERAGLGNEVPATMVLDEQGGMVARILGEAREEDVKAPVEWLLSAKTSPPPHEVIKRY
ncbi:MAG: TlpA disulfide reductase family protein [Terracidiphilus sp.]|jgi:thiol-disulfide isomerase/thioredoxin